MKLRRFLPAGCLMAVLAATSVEAMEGVVASIKPVHSLVAAVMDGAGAPELLVEGGASPHTYSLRPSEAGMLEEAKVVFWVGEGIETFLAKPLAALAGDAEVVALAETPGIDLLDARKGGVFEPDADEAEHEHEHDHGTKDMHIWLDPENARLMVRLIATTLAKSDPENAAVYEKNADFLDRRFDDLTAETNATLAPVRGKPFIVFHDGYRYFEERFDAPAAGSITISPDRAPGAERLREIRDRIARLEAVCVFSEPQFEPTLARVVTEGTGAQAGVLDPLGAEIPEGPELYFDLIRKLATSMAECLSSGGGGN